MWNFFYFSTVPARHRRNRWKRSWVSLKQVVGINFCLCLPPMKIFILMVVWYEIAFTQSVSPQYRSTEQGPPFECQGNRVRSHERGDGSVSTGNANENMSSQAKMAVMIFLRLQAEFYGDCMPHWPSITLHTFVKHKAMNLSVRSIGFTRWKSSKRVILSARVNETLFQYRGKWQVGSPNAPLWRAELGNQTRYRCA